MNGLFVAIREFDPTGRLRGLFAGLAGSGVSLLVLSSLGTQLIALLCSPMVSRLYSPEAFGQFAIFLSTVSIVTVMVTLRYEQALPLARNEAEARTLARATITIAIGLSLAASLILPLLAYRVIGIDPIGDAPPWLLRAAGLSAGLGATGTVLYFLMLRRANYRGVAIVRIAAAVVSNAAFAALGYLGWGMGGLLAGHFAAAIIAIVAYARLVRARDDASGDMVPVQARALLAEHRRFPCFILPSALLSTMGVHLSSLLCARVFTAHEVGIYSFALRMVDLPGAFLSSAISDVFYREASRLREDRAALGRLMLAYFKRLLAFAIPVYLAVAIVAGEGVPFVFGEEWRESGFVIQVLTPMNLISFIASPLASVAVVMGRQSWSAIFQVFIVLTTLGAVWWGDRQQDFRSFLVAYAGGRAVVYLGILGSCWWLVRDGGTAEAKMP